jgi:hypothetical protein
LFSHNKCDGGCDAPKAHCHKSWSWHASSCDSCEHEGFFAKLKGKLGSHGHRGCCDGGCASGGCAPSVAPAEPVNPPKKMPPPPPGKVGVETEATQLAPISPAATPSIEIVAPAVPAVPGITNQPRSPF